MKMAVLIFLFFSLSALAEPTCLKQKPAEPFSGVIPHNFILIPVCKDAASAIDLVSNYIFLGDATVNGTIRYENSDIFDYYPTFSVDPQSEKLVPANIISFRLDGSSPNAEKAFHLPKLTSEVNCWQAPATIQLKYINVQVDGGTDAAGNFLTDYRVISVGKYEHCKSKDS